VMSFPRHNTWPRLTSEYGRCLHEVAGWLAS